MIQIFTGSNKLVHYLYECNRSSYGTNKKNISIYETNENIYGTDKINITDGVNLRNRSVNWLIQVFTGLIKLIQVFTGPYGT